MSRLLRWALNLSAALSAALFLATCVLWVRSFTAQDSVSWRQGEAVRSVSTGGGGVRFISLGDSHTGPSGVSDLAYERNPPVTGDQSFLGEYQTRFYWAGLGWAKDTILGLNIVQFMAPFWLLAPAVFLPAALWAATTAGRKMRRRRRQRSGLCPKCGYDVRATSGRCPECGAPQPNAAAPHAGPIAPAPQVLYRWGRRWERYRALMARSRIATAAVAIALMAVVAAVILRDGQALTRPPPATSATATPSPPSDYPGKLKKITTLLQSAPTSRPSAADANELLDQALHEADFRIRVRAMAVLPFLNERDEAIDALIACLRDRDPGSSGGGNVPLYAARYLADMKATRATPDVEDWVRYLEREAPYAKESLKIILQKSSEDLARLKRASGTPAAPPAGHLPAVRVRP